MTQLSVTDQLEVDRLNDDIRRLTQENKDAFIQRMRLEADKNKLENLLTNNLIRRRDELQQALQEISVEDRNRKLDHCRSELGTVERRLDDVSDALKDVEKKVSDLSRKQKEAQSDLEKLRFKEKDIDERLAESAKDFDKMASRQTALQ
jgi:structural maintenance of chromosome 3 (chondroitin sulfate proteoglycan 6)